MGAQRGYCTRTASASKLASDILRYPAAVNAGSCFALNDLPIAEAFETRVRGDATKDIYR